jgi:hypothetical protein
MTEPPVTPPVVDNDLAITMQVSTPIEWLELNDGVDLVLAKETFAEVTVSKRNTQAINPYLEGTHTVASLRDEVMETVAVYVHGVDHFATALKVRVVTDAFDQPEYRIIFAVGPKGPTGAVEPVDPSAWTVWWCGAANYRIDSSQELLHARMAKIILEVPRHPVAQLTQTKPAL